MQNMKIILATGNKNKLKEIKEIWPEAEVEGVSSDAEETGKTFRENAEIKAESVWKKTGGLVLADDSGLCVDALGGEPGIFSARYLGEDTSYDIKNHAIINKLNEMGLEGKDRAAHFTCAICAILPDGRKIFTEAYMPGEIAKEIKGSNGFGYDPILFIPEKGRNSAELSPEEKNAISHRGQALRAMAERLEKEIPKDTRR